ncbi:hypothetical protein CMO96_03625 [Candidatus Woesebacteria bacterium]|nr:hypothetical protein [Candidatus Woesebacteria bacterium]|tara:strand:+ start:99 stop:431 length:333 start_codon:yes stop_codon:yes gene_type:complete
MSKIFYDKYIVLAEVEVGLRKLDLEHEEKQELEHLIDEMVHHRVFDRILTHLPKDHHTEFLDRFHKAPYDAELIDYVDDRIEESVEKHVKDEMEKLKKEILGDIKASKKK